MSFIVTSGNRNFFRRYIN